MRNRISKLQHVAHNFLHRRRSSNEDYRWLLSHNDASHKPHLQHSNVRDEYYISACCGARLMRLLMRSQTLRGHTSDYYRRPAPLQAPATTRHANKPDSYSVSDIPFASPSPHVGLTVGGIDKHAIRKCPFNLTLTLLLVQLIQPLVPDSERGMNSSLRRKDHHGGGDWPRGTGTLTSIPSPVRATNPLSPSYDWNTTSAGRVPPYPTAKSEPGEWRLSSPVRLRSLDVSDIPGAQPSPKFRARKV